MSLSRAIRNSIAKANKITKDLQVSIQHYQWIGIDPLYGGPLFDTPVTRFALVEMKQRLYRLPDGQEILQRASVTFLQPIPYHGAAERREPLDPRDKIVLPNGYTGAIKNVEGLENTFADSPYMIEAVLG